MICPETCKGCNNVNGSCDKGCHPGWRGDYCGIGRLTHNNVTTHARAATMLMVCVIMDVSSVIVSLDLVECNSVNIAITVHVLLYMTI